MFGRIHRRVPEDHPRTAGGSREWSHQYGNAANGAYAGESLGGASSTEDLEVQWLGRPGPRAQPDRNGRKPSPLSTGGRLFVQGLNRMIALDAFNGTILWSKELPRLQRFNMPRDSSNWAADGSFVFTAMEGACWKWHADSGELAARWSVPEAAVGSHAMDWSYVSPYRDKLIGSAVYKDSAYSNFWEVVTQGGMMQSPEKSPSRSAAKAFMQ